MGSDINIYPEILLSDGKWKPLAMYYSQGYLPEMKISEPELMPVKLDANIYRHYVLFGALANKRNKFNVPCSIRGRGLPNDCSDLVKNTLIRECSHYYQSYDDPLSEEHGCAGYITMPELKELAINFKSYDIKGWIPKHYVRGYDESDLARSDSDWTVYSVGSVIPKEDEKACYKVTWRTDIFNEMYKNISNSIDKITYVHDLSRIRLVFWFDD
jgi:hypothetical protein